jgi:hypothetical protein
MKKYIILFFICTSFVFQNCKKEDKILKNLVGTWSFNEFKRPNGYTKTDFTDVYSMQFFSHKKAYTATMKGIFKVDYADPTKTDLIDTFQFQLKRDVIDITSVQNKKVNNAFPNITPTLLKRRFKIEGHKTSSIKLTRIDSTDLYIKATKQ